MKIYPQVSPQELEQLWGKCDFYLDINHYREIYDAVNMAHWHNLLIMGFENTVHRRDVLADELIFPERNNKNMIIKIKEFLDSPSCMETLLTVQQSRKSKIFGEIMG